MLVQTMSDRLTKTKKKEKLFVCTDCAGYYNKPATCHPYVIAITESPAYVIHPGNSLNHSGSTFNYFTGV